MRRERIDWWISCLFRTSIIDCVAIVDGKICCVSQWYGCGYGYGCGYAMMLNCESIVDVYRMLCCDLDFPQHFHQWILVLRLTEMTDSCIALPCFVCHSLWLEYIYF